LEFYFGNKLKKGDKNMSTSRSTLRQEECSQKQTNSLLLSAAAGGIVGATTALLFAPQSGEKLRKGICETYDDISRTVQDFSGDVMEKGQKAASTAAEYVDSVKGTASHLFAPSKKTDSNLPLFIGAIGGALLGAATVVLLSSKEEKCEGFANKIKDAGKSFTENLSTGVETAKEIIDAISDKVHHNGEAVEEHLKEMKNHSPLKEALEWAALGLRAWQNMKKGR
jgi:gas vesicle protein